MTLKRLSDAVMELHDLHAPAISSEAGVEFHADPASAGASDDAAASEEKRGNIRIGQATANRALWVADWLRATRQNDGRNSVRVVGDAANQRAEHPTLPDRALYSRAFTSLLKRRACVLERRHSLATFPIEGKPSTRTVPHERDADRIGEASAEKRRAIDAEGGIAAGLRRRAKEAGGMVWEPGISRCAA